ncbi:MAG: helix-turn-helix domain-containing protein [Erysipelotrichaceae bacterium]
MNITEIKKHLNTLYEKTYVPTTILDNQGNLCFPTNSPLFTALEKFPYLIEIDNDPLHIINSYHYLVGSFRHKNHIFLIGPCSLIGSEPKNNDILSDYKAYFSSETIDSFTKMCTLLYKLITSKDINQKQVPIKYSRLKTNNLGIKKKIEEIVHNRRIEDMTRDSYQFELRFLDYVKRGKKDKIDWIISQMNKTYTVKLSQNNVDSAKIKFISIVTLMTRLAIENGVSLERAFGLSDALILDIHRIIELDKVIEHIKYASYEFIELINDTPKNCSSLIRSCLNYIDTNIYEKITLQQLSDLTGYSSVYISANFKKELKINLMTYILEKKVEEAKHLLLFTEYTTQEISSLLNFTSQSYFTQKFKIATSLTPKKYRDKNFKYL